MSDTAVPAPAKAAPGAPQKLDDVLLAMDVVDTLRHRSQVALDELSAEERETQLVARLKEIYDAQGITVPDTILKDGVKALEEQRFVYKPPKPSIGVSLAKLYVSRGRWAPVVGGVVGLALAIGFGWQFLIAGPAAQEAKQLPIEIARVAEDARTIAIEPTVDARIDTLATTAQDQVSRGDKAAAKASLVTLQGLRDQVASAYDIRIVARPGEDTGFWRIPDVNPNGRNFYLVVEGVGPGGGVERVPVTSEETQKTETVSKWAQRVSEETFNRIAGEKKASGVIHDDVLGTKQRGYLAPTFVEPVPGGAITQW